MLFVTDCSPVFSKYFRCQEGISCIIWFASTHATSEYSLKLKCEGILTFELQQFRFFKKKISCSLITYFQVEDINLSWTEPPLNCWREARLHLHQTVWGMHSTHTSARGGTNLLKPPGKSAFVCTSTVREGKIGFSCYQVMACVDHNVQPK